MDDFWVGICGTLWPGWWRGPWPGPAPWLRIIAGIIGGIAAWEVLGPTVGSGSGFIGMTMIGVIGGNFLAVVVDAAFGMIRGPVAAPQVNRTEV